MNSQNTNQENIGNSENSENSGPTREDRSDIVLLCNPRAGGRWQELAKILDSEEAQHVHRIVTDDVSDIGPALKSLGRDAGLLIIYGGDGTIQQILDRMSPSAADDLRLALIGGGTMNVTSRWCGMSRKPAENFRAVVQAFRSGNLPLLEVPLLEIRNGERVRQGFTFGNGPLVRIVDRFERSAKNRRAVFTVATGSVVAALTGFPRELAKTTAPMKAKVTLDGETLDTEEFTILFANVTGQINPGVEPFPKARERGTFYCAAYAVSPRELTLVAPLLMRGLLPVDWASLLSPASLGKRLGELLSAGRIRLSRDPRYVNRSVRHMEVQTDEKIYTVDGEILEAIPGEPIHVQLGTQLKLALNPVAALTPAIKQALTRVVDRVKTL